MLLFNGLPLSHHWQIAGLTKTVNVLIDGGSVPLTVAVEIQKPFSGRGSEDTDFRCARAAPIADDRNITSGTERAEAFIERAAVEFAVTIDI